MTELATGEDELLVIPAAPLPGVLLPEFELEPEDAAPVDVPDGVPLPLADELPLTRAGVIELAEVLLYPPEPPHPTIAASREKESKTAVCRIRPPLAVTGAVLRPIPLREAMDASTQVTLGKLLRTPKYLT